LVTLAELTEEFWAWRVAAQPDSYDDITRVDRPVGWTADWSAASVAARRDALAKFTARHRQLDLSREPVAVQVNGRLLGSALARVRWELDVLRGWQRNPGFYVDQSLVCVYNLLLEPPPFTADRAAAIVAHLKNVPTVLTQARENLAGHGVAPFARYAVRLLATADSQLRTAMTALAPFVDHADLPAATDQAAQALVAYREWLEQQIPSFTGETAIGPAAFGFFLHRVALLPYSADQLRAMGRQEWDRAVATEVILKHRNRDAAEQPLLPDTAALIAREREDELELRRFYVERDVLSQPETLRHYRYAEMPPYLEPLGWLGVEHYTGGPDTDALHYVTAPRDDLPYFQLANARDPRAGLIHEGVHAQQLALSWQHPEPVRRRYHDSAVNEGIAFYHEELMFLMGLFDDAPAGGEFVANAMRLRALRVEVDIGLALGDLTLDQAADRLADAVPMDRATAWEEAAFFAGNPGQGMSYQIGKLQILDLLTRCGQRADFDLRAFHDRLWLEGNVPIALQRWEVLGLRDHLDQADALPG
jgi:uncharacterized protein (DUF885 family)